MQTRAPHDFVDLDDEGVGRLTQRIEHILDGASLDCVCRERLHDVLRRFAEFETTRVQRRALANACNQRQRITSLLKLMEELEDLNVNEADTSVFTELAYLFDDVANSAHLGAIAMRKLAAGPI